MNLKNISDSILLSTTKRLAEKEREVLVEILHHLREIERRRLYSELGYQSLFDYAVRELKYSDGQAGRRIQAMRLIKEIPEVEAKITSGALNLTNISKAQSFFRKSESKEVSMSEKLEILEKLENKTTREGEKELILLNPAVALPAEKERLLTEEHSEYRFVMDRKTKKKLEAVRSLLGPKGATVSFKELIAIMAELSEEVLRAKKFGRKRALDKLTPATQEPPPKKRPTPFRHFAPAQELKCKSSNPRYIPQKVSHFIWNRDQSQCTLCASKTNLNIDHILPVALGGTTDTSNLRLLCFHCNQREAIKYFGIVDWKVQKQKNFRVAKG